MSNSSFKNVID